MNPRRLGEITHNHLRLHQWVPLNKLYPKSTIASCNLFKSRDLILQNLPRLPRKFVNEKKYVSNTNINVSGLGNLVAVRKGVRSSTQHTILDFFSYGHLSSSVQTLITSLVREKIPANIQEAWSDERWKRAILEEMNALEKNGTWEIIKKPRNSVPMGCKWIFTIKYKADGTIDRFKAKLVTKGYTQTYGIDYQETFVPFAKINKVRVLLSLVANLDWPLQQLDVKNAFLNGDLEEEVFMELPPGFSEEGQVEKVCRLEKALYGLKQLLRAWFAKFTKAIKRHGYTQAHSDHTLFYKHQHKLVIIIVYVDDIIITGDDHKEADRIKKNLAQCFEMKDLGKLRYFLGMEVARNKTGISVSQRKYVMDLLIEIGMLGCKPVYTPMDPTIKLGSKEEDPLVDKGQYQRLVGKLIYLVHTRPDIAFSVNNVS